MCIHLGNGANLLKPVVPPTDEAVKHRNRLAVCLVCQFILSIMTMVSDPYTGIYSFFLVVMLACGMIQMNYCCVSFYMLYITMSWVYNISNIGLAIQNGSISFIYNQSSTSAAYQFTVSIISAVYQSVAFFVCFCAYREFAAMLIDF